MRADLHAHSVWSDGAYPPSELVRRAAAAGVALFSLTDHDTMGGSEEAAEAARLLGVRFVRGWEVSAYEGACKVHILGYGCRADGAYERFLADRFEGARVRLATMLRLANEHFGTDVTLADAERFHAHREAPLHTMHLVAAFAERLGREKGELYGSVFAYGGPAFSGEGRPTPADAIAVIHATGGVAVLAHPGRIEDFTPEETEEFRKFPERREALAAKSRVRRAALVDRLAASGLDGIECHYPTHTAEETEYFSAYASAHGLLVTGGSDYHAEGAHRAIGFPVFGASDALAERLLSLEGSV